MKKLITILMLLCSVASVWGQDAEGKELLAKAQAGDAKAQHLVGLGYEFESRGFPKDENEAFKWYKKSAEQGFAGGQYNLGRCYIYGNGVAKNEEEGLRWLRKAAAQEYVPAMYSLGLYNEDTNKDKAIFSSKEGMDTLYAKHGEEIESVAEGMLQLLQELGVTNHPGDNISTASNSSSNSSRSFSLDDPSTYAEYTSTFFTSGKHYNVKTYGLISPRMQTDCDRGDFTISISGKTITFNGDGETFSYTITSSLTKVKVKTSIDANAKIPMYKAIDNEGDETNLCAIRFNDGRVVLFEYYYNDDIKAYIPLSFYEMY